MIVAPSSRRPGPPRFLLFSGNYNYVRDGANQALNRLISYLEGRGVETRIVAPTVKKPAFEPAGTLLSAPSFPIPFRPEYRVAYRFPFALRRQLAGFAPDLVQVSAPDYLGHLAFDWAERHKITRIASVHTRFETYMSYYGLDFLRGLMEMGLRKFYNRCEVVFTPSQTMAEQFRSIGVRAPFRSWARGVQAERFSPAQRDLAWRTSHGFGPDEVLVAFVSRLVLEKGLDVVEAVHQRLKDRNIAHRLVIVGDGPARGWMERRAPDARFLGFLSGDDLGKAYANADIFLFPSATETFGNVTLEAMASGLASVCADASGSRDLIKSGETGLLCPVGDVGAFTDAVAALITDAPKRAQMGKTARVHALKFDWTAIFDRLFEDYARLSPAFADAAARAPAARIVHAQAP